MPLLRPEITQPQPQALVKALRMAGIKPPPELEAHSEAENLKQILDEEDLTTRHLINELGIIIRSSEPGPVRLRAIENALKLHGHLTNNGNQGTGTSAQIIFYSPTIREEKTFQTVETTFQRQG